MRKKYLLVAACSLIATALILAGLYASGILFRKTAPKEDLPVVQENLPEFKTKLSDIEILPLKYDSAGIDTTSGFRLSYSGQLDETFLRSSLKVRPEQQFTINKENDGAYLVNFNTPLKANSVYNFEIKNEYSGDFRSWAFQTKQTLAVTGTLPRNQAIQVPVESGIEVTFTSEKLENPESFFEITPAVNGRFEIHRKTLVFVPEKLEYGTVYTVTVKKGLGISGSTEKLPEDYSFSFQTAAEVSSNRKGYFSFAESDYNLTEKAAPVLQVYASEDLLEADTSVQIFKYPDADKYLSDLKKYDALPFWAISDFQKKTYDTTSLEKAAAFKTKLAKQENNYWYATYLVLPENLPQGYYLLKASVAGIDYYTQLQVNNLSVYIMITGSETLVWVNDSAAGKPVPNALISGEGITDAQQTSDNGMSIIKGNFSESSTGRNYYYRISTGGQPDFIARVSAINYYYYSQRYYGMMSSSKYWNYLYLDKGVYLPEDKINIWGMIKPRDNAAAASTRTFTLELVSSNYSYNQNNQAVIMSQEISPSEIGTFSSSYDLSGFTPGSYLMNVRSGDEIISSTYFQVMEYVKPAYKIELTPSKTVMYEWDKADMAMQASFFEGSPLPGLELHYSYSTGYSGNTGREGRIVCDENGYASLALNPTTDVSTWRPQYLYFYVNNQNAEEEEIRANSSIIVFPRDTMLEAKSSINNNKCLVSLTTSKIDIGKLDAENKYYYSEDEYRGDPVNIDVDVKLYERYWVKKETGEYYDFINKKTVKKYDYQEAERLINTYKLKTANGKANFTFDTEKEKNYYIIADFKDSAGRPTTEQYYFYTWSYGPFESDNYHISTDNNEYRYKKDKNVSLHVNQGSNKVTPPEDGKFLYITLKDGIAGATISNSPDYSFSFSENFIPNMFVKALYFDGTDIHDAGIRDFIYDFSDEKLDIDIKTDKENYRPGDLVKVSIDVRDKNGKPRISEVNLSVVDAAFFAVMDQYADTLSSLYSANVPNGIITDYISYSNTGDNGDATAEGGEGGDSMSIRTDFRDSACFTSVMTDNNGHAEVSFRLPDNLTSWRLTYQAVTGDLKAGSGRTTIKCCLPFFVNTIFNKIFISGDSPSLLIRSYGTELKNTDDVEYSIQLENKSGLNKNYTAGGKGNATSAVPLGRLEEGEYTITVKGKSGSLSDSMAVSFKVVPQILEAAKLNDEILTENMSLTGSDNKLTRLVFMNKDASVFYNELLSLYWSWGDRLDQKVSRLIAGEMLQKYYNEDFVTNEAVDLSKYQTSDGGLALLTYDSSNAELSAKVCAFTKDRIDAEALSEYFYDILDNRESSAANVAYSYWGLASLYKPVLVDIQNLVAASQSQLGLEEKLVLGIALAEIGDFGGSEKIYNEVLTQYGMTEGNLTYIKYSDSRDETTKLTALCSIIALKLNKPEKDGLFMYTKSNSTSELLTNLERLIYISSYIPGISQKSEFTYELDGKSSQIVLTGDGKYSLILTPEKLNSIKFSNISGNISVISSYTGNVNDIHSGSDSLISLERKYYVNGKATLEFERSDLIKIVLTPVFKEDCPDGWYQITDVLPAGFRYISARPDDREGWYPSEVSGQKVTFGTRYGKNLKKSRNIVYYARAVTPGTFTADNAIIKHNESNIFNFALKQSVLIK